MMAMMMMSPFLKFGLKVLFIIFILKNKTHNIIQFFLKLTTNN
jgi:hypothetical protein